MNGKRAGFGGVEGKAAQKRETVQDPRAFGPLRHQRVIDLLIEVDAGLMATSDGR